MSLHYLCAAEETRAAEAGWLIEGDGTSNFIYEEMYGGVHRSDRSSIAKPPTAMQRPPRRDASDLSAVASTPGSRPSRGKFNFEQALRFTLEM